MLGGEPELSGAAQPGRDGQQDRDDVEDVGPRMNRGQTHATMRKSALGAYAARNAIGTDTVVPISNNSLRP